MFTGEIISLVVAISWTATALLAEVATKKMGSLPLNVIRMFLSLVFLALTLWMFTGYPYPAYTDSQTWLWLGLSGFVGYVFGDYCLFSSYIYMNSRFGQLFMTLAAPFAAIAAWVFMGEEMTLLALLGMVITLSGIAMSIFYKKGKDEEHHGRLRSVSLKFPLKGIFFGIGAGMGQGVGLALSKVGMQAYESSIACQGAELGSMMPVASTMIRAIIGMIGFSMALFIFSHHGKEKLHNAVTDKKAMLCAIGATVFGPFIGVSLSLMATLYTSTGIAQTLMALTPVFIILPSYLLFHQKVTRLEVIGAIISVIGVSLFFL